MKAAVKNLLVWLFAMAFLASSVAHAQTAPPPFKTEELEQLAAPIALYPDELLTQIMMASTYPLEVVQAARWMESRKKQKPEQIQAEAEKQPWDPSVQALTAFPEVLDMMNTKLDWTQKLGDAVLAQQKDFMAAVQRLRKQAEAAGNLKSTEQIKVVKETETIIIQPANPTVIYVPQYNPTVVYGAWPYPAYPPYYYPSPYYPVGSALGAGIAFGVGVAIVGGIWNNNNHYPDWHGGNINVNRNTNINVNNTNINKANINTANVKNWEHNPSHRQGVNYRDAGSQQRYGNNVAGADTRQQYRGRDTSSVQPGSSQSGTRDLSGADRAQTQNRAGQADRSGAQAQDRAGQFGGGDRSQSMNRMSGSDARSFQGVGEGSRAQQSFDRGRSSNQSMAAQRGSSGGGRSGGSFGGGGGRGGGGRR
jgi:hypothetical protein